MIVEFKGKRVGFHKIRGFSVGWAITVDGEMLCCSYDRRAHGHDMARRMAEALDQRLENEAAARNTPELMETVGRH